MQASHVSVHCTSISLSSFPHISSLMTPETWSDSQSMVHSRKFSLGWSEKAQTTLIFAQMSHLHKHVNNFLYFLLYLEITDRKLLVTSVFCMFVWECGWEEKRRRGLLTSVVQAYLSLLQTIATSQPEAILHALADNYPFVRYLSLLSRDLDHAL